MGEKGKDIPIVIGYQDTTHPKKDKKLRSVLPLDMDQISDCKDNSWKYLNKSMIKILKKKNKKLANELDDVLNKESDSDESSD